MSSVVEQAEGIWHKYFRVVQKDNVTLTPLNSRAKLDIRYPSYNGKINLAVSNIEESYPSPSFVLTHPFAGENSTISVVLPLSNKAGPIHFYCPLVLADCFRQLQKEGYSVELIPDPVYGNSISPKILFFGLKFELQQAELSYRVAPRLLIEDIIPAEELQRLMAEYRKNKSGVLSKVYHIVQTNIVDLNMAALFKYINNKQILTACYIRNLVHEVTQFVLYTYENFLGASSEKTRNFLLSRQDELKRYIAYVALRDFCRYSGLALDYRDKSYLHRGKLRYKNSVASICITLAKNCNVMQQWNWSYPSKIFIQDIEYLYRKVVSYDSPGHYQNKHEETEFLTSLLEIINKKKIKKLPSTIHRGIKIAEDLYMPTIVPRLSDLSSYHLPYEENNSDRTVYFVDYSYYQDKLNLLWLDLSLFLSKAHSDPTAESSDTDATEESSDSDDIEENSDSIGIRSVIAPPLSACKEYGEDFVMSVIRLNIPVNIKPLSSIHKTGMYSGFTSDGTPMRSSDLVFCIKKYFKNLWFNFNFSGTTPLARRLTFLKSIFNEDTCEALIDSSDFKRIFDMIEKEPYVSEETMIKVSNLVVRQYINSIRIFAQMTGEALLLNELVPKGGKS